MDKSNIILIITLVSLILLVPILSIFHDDTFYDYAYSRNGAYESFDKEFVWSVTDNFQGFLLDKEPLRHFNESQSAHLQDVKDLYKKGTATVIILVLLHIISLSTGKTDYARVMRTTALISFIALIILSLLAINWQSFFLKFHQVFFTGNYMFHPESLMLRMWGGNFFPLAAGYAAAQSLLLILFMWIFGKLIIFRKR